jgi:hypothetical protein
MILEYTGWTDWGWLARVAGTYSDLEVFLAICTGEVSAPWFCCSAPRRSSFIAKKPSGPALAFSVSPSVAACVFPCLGFVFAFVAHTYRAPIVMGKERDSCYRGNPGESITDILTRALAQKVVAR